MVDVLWHHRAGSIDVTVTAYELNWHKHIGEVTTNWHSTHRTPG
ncbi:MAG: hypothetical protein ACRDJ9_23415 [Dehalococcoidia bacterium]